MIFRARSSLLEVSPDLEGRPVLCLDAAEIDANAVTLDVLARLALTARRCGYRIALRDPSPELVDLIEFAGLTQALPQAPLRSDSIPPRC
jgi:hypothetical protein